MEFAFMIEVLPNTRSVLGIEVKKQPVKVQVDPEDEKTLEERTAYSFLIGLGLLHIELVWFK